MMFSLFGNVYDVERCLFFYAEIFIDGSVVCEIERIGAERDGAQYLLPGLIDSHVHIESSMLLPVEFSKIASKHGTVAVVTDPHEIANVLGVEGVDLMIQNSKLADLKFFFGVPSCVPATKYETSGAVLNAESVAELLRLPDIWFLSEVMDYPSVINSQNDIVQKIEFAKFYEKPIDGHAPSVSGQDLVKYVSAGISTDHECFTIEEAVEKIKLGMKVQIREGSAAKNFEALFPLIDMYPDEIMLCTDDCHPDDLLQGHMDIIVRKAINKGLKIENIIKAACVNAVEHYKLPVGFLRVGDDADFIIVDNLSDFNVLKTYIKGKEVGENKGEENNTNKIFLNNFNRKPISIEQLSVKNDAESFDVIEVIDGELVTNMIKYETNISNTSEFEADIEKDILKIISLSRYDNAKPVIGFVKNFNLKKGAIASSVAHDSHNIIAVGTNDNDLFNAINTIIHNKGGIIAVSGNDCAVLKLEVAGLMSNLPYQDVAKMYEKVHNKAIEFGSDLTAPFMTLSFMGLLVIPAFKISDKGLFDVNNFRIIK